jgi:tRNA acetyltransferase TAN1
MEPNVLVSYSFTVGFFEAKQEISTVLRELGDDKAEIERLTKGIIGAKTSLDNRQVVDGVREKFIANPLVFNFTLKWVAVDFWCRPDFEEIKKIVKEEIIAKISEDDRWAVQVEKHGGELHSQDVIEAIAPLIEKGKVDLDHPEKIIRIDLFPSQAAVTLLKPENIFSLAKGE